VATVRRYGRRSSTLEDFCHQQGADSSPGYRFRSLRPLPAVDRSRLPNAYANSLGAVTPSRQHCDGRRLGCRFVRSRYYKPTTIHRAVGARVCRSSSSIGRHVVRLLHLAVPDQRMRRGVATVSRQRPQLGLARTLIIGERQVPSTRHSPTVESKYVDAQYQKNFIVGVIIPKTEHGQQATAIFTFWFISGRDYVHFQRPNLGARRSRISPSTSQASAARSTATWT